MSQREETYEALLRAAVGQLKAWANKYGQHGPSWLPPGGDLQLMETIDDWLATAPAKADQPIQVVEASPADMEIYKAIADNYHGSAQQAKDAARWRWIAACEYPEDGLSIQWDGEGTLADFVDASIAIAKATPATQTP